MNLNASGNCYRIYNLKVTIRKKCRQSSENIINVFNRVKAREYYINYRDEVLQKRQEYREANRKSIINQQAKERKSKKHDCREECRETVHSH